jgi:hypothetical protein
MGAGQPFRGCPKAGGCGEREGRFAGAGGERATLNAVLGQRQPDEQWLDGGGGLSEGGARGEWCDESDPESAQDGQGRDAPQEVRQ